VRYINNLWVLDVTMWTQVMKHTDPFLRLKTSNFRRGFYLTEQEKNMVYEHGFERLREMTQKVVEGRLLIPTNDGSQTPYRGHPIFKAQHATATCCRKCIFKWHRIPRHRALENHEIEYIVDMIMRWIMTHS
jgi:hypothetical protein